jgi:hypothetical protein
MRTTWSWSMVMLVWATAMTHLPERPRRLIRSQAN